tara:strand:+ start:3298 stop:4188 length:891 start_codon:yes stop_codon:yes gene_type:complete
MRFLTEASGGMTSAYLQRAIKEAGHSSVGSDIKALTSAVCLSDDSLVLPPVDDPCLWEKLEVLLKLHNIDVVIPTLDEMMPGWAQRKSDLHSRGIEVIISPRETIDLFRDKWFTYRFFVENSIPTPKTSLVQEYRLIKPRCGRGSSGVRIVDNQVDMTGLISQEVVKGQEYTVDVFCDHLGEPVYIVPRKRLHTVDGKSVEAVTARHPSIEHYVKKIVKASKIIGPVNVQCFLDGESIFFIELNPRFGGGTALGMAATENWITLIIDNLIRRKPIAFKPIKYGLRMIRYYAECFIS